MTRARGLLFDKEKFLLDPYARAVTGQSRWGVRPAKDSSYHARVVEDVFDWGDFEDTHVPFQDMVIYEMHVRGFTMHESSHVEHPGTFAGLMEKLPYLKELGVNAVELMPVFEFDELADERVIDGRQLINYWGYNTVCYFAPNTGYTAAIEYNREGTEPENPDTHAERQRDRGHSGRCFQPHRRGQRARSVLFLQRYRQQYLLHADPGRQILQLFRRRQHAQL